MIEAAQAKAKAAAQACGELVQALRSIPGVNVAGIDQAAAALRADLMHLVNSAKPQQQ